MKYPFCSCWGKTSGTKWKFMWQALWGEGWGEVMGLFKSEIIEFEPDLWPLMTLVLMKGKGPGHINMSQHEAWWGEIRLQHRDTSMELRRVTVPSERWSAALGSVSLNPSCGGLPIAGPGKVVKGNAINSLLSPVSHVSLGWWRFAFKHLSFCTNTWSVCSPFGEAVVTAFRLCVCVPITDISLTHGKLHSSKGKAAFHAPGL